MNKTEIGEKFAEIWSRDGEQVGYFLGWRDKLCTLEGCKGLRVAVRWKDGKVTWPCSQGIGSNHRGFKIL